MKAFCEVFPGGVVFKTLATWHYGLRETRLLLPDDLPLLSGLHSCPTIFQQHVGGKFDVRVTIVFEKVFSAAIHFHEGRSPVDGRLDSVPIIEITLSDEFIVKLIRFHKFLGLTYGAYDFRMTMADELVFFEVNPDGQYLFIEMATGQPISQALAEGLMQNIQID